VYVIALTLAFTVFAIWRLYRRKGDRVIEEREEFLAYPQTSPEIYAWLPYHRETHGEDSARSAPVNPAGIDAIPPAASGPAALGPAASEIPGSEAAGSEIAATQRTRG
jgi:hypothetical protein